MTVKELDSNIVEKIQKMLATANDKGATESEAQTAMLLAQKFMAKHGLEMADLEAKMDSEQKKEVDKNFSDSFKTEWWQGRLAQVIGDNFRCFCYISKQYGGKQKIVFVGLKGDAEIAKTVFMFAANVVPHLAKEYLKTRKKQIEKDSGYDFKSMTDIELQNLAKAKLRSFELQELEDKYKENEKVYKMRMIMKIKEALNLNVNAAGIKNDYITGFIAGLKSQYKEQVTQEGWGLILVKDNEVVETFKNLDLKRSGGSSAKRSGDLAAKNAGYEKGKSWASPKGGIQG